MEVMVLCLVSVTGRMYRSDDITSGLTNKGFCDSEDVWKCWFD